MVASAMDGWLNASIATIKAGLFATLLKITMDPKQPLEQLVAAKDFPIFKWAVVETPWIMLTGFQEVAKQLDQEPLQELGQIILDLQTRATKEMEEADRRLSGSIVAIPS
jgi:hypothetical protein